MLKKQVGSQQSLPPKNLAALFSLLSLCLLVACGAKDQPVPGTAQLVSGTSGNDSDMISAQRVNCFGENACPSSIAKIVSIIPGGDKHCTGFLINNKTLLTAASCIPEELRKEVGADCSNRVFILFPETNGYPATRVPCGSIGYSSELDDSHPAFIKENYARINLAIPVDRQGLVISNEGIARVKDKKFISWRVSTESGETGNQSIIKKYDCDVIEETYGNPMAKGKFYPNPTIGNCTYYNEFGVRTEEDKLYRGNLGAPILNSAGRVVGIIGEDLMSAEEYKKLADDGFIHLKYQTQKFEDLKIMKFATNLACVSEFSETSRPTECNTTFNQEQFDQKREELLKTEIADRMEEAENYIRENNRLDNGKKLQWNIAFSPIQNHRREVIYTPKCYEAPDVWLPTEDSLYQKLLTFKLWLKSEAEMKVSFNNLGILIRLNGFLKPEARYEIRKDSEANNTKATVEFELTVKPKKIKDKKSSIIVANGNNQPTQTLTIPVCQ